MKNIEHNDLEDMVFRLEIFFSEILYILDRKNIDTSTLGYALEQGYFEISDIKFF